MKKAIAAKLGLIATALLLTTATATAKDVDGKFGIGFNQSLTSSVSGLAANYWLGNFKLGAILGFEMFSPKDGDGTTDLTVGIQGLFAIARAQNVNLNTGLRVNIGFSDPGAGDSQTGFGFEIPLEVEYWFDDHFSIIGHTGLFLNIIGEKGSPLTGRGEGIEFGFGTGGFSGGVGFNFYF